jgi:Trk K+ transport system NAD-binding subunit
MEISIELALPGVSILFFLSISIVVMVKHTDAYFVPTGKTILHENDKLYIITKDEGLMQIYENMKINTKEQPG